MEPTPTEPTGPSPTGPTGPTESSAFSGLARLIGAGAVDGFLEGRLGRDAFRTRMAPAEARRLFGWPQLNAGLAAHRLVPPRLRLERAGADVTAGLFKGRRNRRGAPLQDLDPVVLEERMRDGATLILDSANELSPPLQGLCEALAAQFGAAVQANMYACWGVTQGFDVHWDDHDVFVVQVEGTKRWPLYGFTRPAPVRREPGVDLTKPETAIDEVTLRPGDVLYLPRGYWHAAIGRGEPTMHLTVGLTRKTGSDFVHWLADHLLSAEVVRADLPLEQDDGALARRLAQVLAAAAEAPEELARLYRRHVDATQAWRPGLSFPDIAAGPVERLRMAPGAVRLRPGGQGALILSWRGVEFTVDARLERPLRDLAAGRTVSLRDLQAAAEGEAGEVEAFVTAMRRRGAFISGQGH